MKLKPLLLAACLAASASSAFADDHDYTIALMGSTPNWTTHFGAEHVAGFFTDTYTFTFSPDAGALLANGGFTNISTKASQFISFTSAALNGNPFILTLSTVPGDGTYSGGHLLPDIATMAPLILTITGTAGDISSYGGNFNVAAVPEPASYGMMLGGLVLLGAVLRRRKQG